MKQAQATRALVASLLIATLVPLQPVVGMSPGLDEDFENPALLGWSRSGLRAEVDCLNAVWGCSLGVAVAAPAGGTVSAERASSYALPTVPYAVAFDFRNDQPSTASSLTHTKLVLNFSGLYDVTWLSDVKLAHPELPLPKGLMGVETPAGLVHTYAYATKTWNRVVLQIDPGARELRVQVKDSTTLAVLDASAPSTLPANGTTLTSTIIRQSFTPENALKDRAAQMNLDRLYVGAATRPWAPQASGFTGPGGGRVTLQWAPPIDDGGAPVKNYTIYAGNSTTDLAYVATVNESTFSYTETDLANATWRVFQVTATNLIGEGPRSESVALRTLGLPSPPRQVKAEPGANVGEIRLSWLTPSDSGGPGASVTAYKVYRGLSNGTTSFVGEIPGGASTTHTFTDKHRRNGTTYHYGVTAVNGLGEGPSSLHAWSKPKADAVTSVANLAPGSGPAWSGQERQVSFTYALAVSECEPNATCPVEHEWRVYEDGNLTGSNGILLASGRSTHPGHAETKAYAVATNVTPLGRDGVHLLKAVVNARVGSTEAWSSAATIQLGLPQPDPACDATPGYLTYLAPKIGSSPPARGHAQEYRYFLDGSTSTFKASFWDGCLPGPAGNGDGQYEFGLGGALLDGTYATPGSTVQVFDSTGLPVAFIVGSDVDGSGVLGDNLGDCLAGPFATQATIPLTCAADSSGKRVLMLLPGDALTDGPVWGRVRVCLPPARPCADVAYADAELHGLVNPPFQPDLDDDGLGDAWQAVVAEGVRKRGHPANNPDLDPACGASCPTHDGLTHRDEYVWNTAPIQPITYCMAADSCATFVPRARLLDADAWTDAAEFARLSLMAVSPTVLDDAWRLLGAVAQNPVGLTSGWGNSPHPEPNTREDVESGFMFHAADTEPSGRRIYLDMHLVQTNAGDFTTPATGNPGPTYQLFAYFGFWKDCNKDGRVGDDLTGLLEYPSALLTLPNARAEIPGTSVCPPRSPPIDPTVQDNHLHPHNDRNVVRELIWITPDVRPTLSPSEVTDWGATVWSDLGGPGEPYDPVRNTIFATMRSLGAQEPESESIDLLRSVWRAFEDVVCAGTPVSHPAAKVCPDVTMEYHSVGYAPVEVQIGGATLETVHLDPNAARDPLRSENVATCFAVAAGELDGAGCNGWYSPPFYLITPQGNCIDGTAQRTVPTCQGVSPASFRMTAYANVSAGFLQGRGVTVAHERGTYGAEPCQSPSPGAGAPDQNGWACDPGKWQPSLLDREFLPKVGGSYVFRDSDPLQYVHFQTGALQAMREFYERNNPDNVAAEADETVMQWLRGGASKAWDWQGTVHSVIDADSSLGKVIQLLDDTAWQLQQTTEPIQAMAKSTDVLVPIVHEGAACAQIAVQHLVNRTVNATQPVDCLLGVVTTVLPKVIPPLEVQPIGLVQGALKDPVSALNATVLPRLPVTPPTLPALDASIVELVPALVADASNSPPPDLPLPVEDASLEVFDWPRSAYPAFLQDTIDPTLYTPLIGALQEADRIAEEHTGEGSNATETIVTSVDAGFVNLYVEDEAGNSWSRRDWPLGVPFAFDSIGGPPVAAAVTLQPGLDGMDTAKLTVLRTSTAPVRAAVLAYVQLPNSTEVLGLQADGRAAALNSTVGLPLNLTFDVGARGADLSLPDPLSGLLPRNAAKYQFSQTVNERWPTSVAASLFSVDVLAQPKVKVPGQQIDLDLAFPDAPVHVTGTLTGTPGDAEGLRITWEATDAGPLRVVARMSNHTPQGKATSESVIRIEEIDRTNTLTAKKTTTGVQVTETASGPTRGFRYAWNDTRQDGAWQDQGALSATYIPSLMTFEKSEAATPSGNSTRIRFSSNEPLGILDYVSFGKDGTGCRRPADAGHEYVIDTSTCLTIHTSGYTSLDFVKEDGSLELVTERAGIGPPLIVDIAGTKESIYAFASSQPNVTLAAVWNDEKVNATYAASADVAEFRFHTSKTSSQDKVVEVRAHGIPRNLALDVDKEDLVVQAAAWPGPLEDMWVHYAKAGPGVTLDQTDGALVVFEGDEFQALDTRVRNFTRAVAHLDITTGYVNLDSDSASSAPFQFLWTDGTGGLQGNFSRLPRNVTLSTVKGPPFVLDYRSSETLEDLSANVTFVGKKADDASDDSTFKVQLRDFPDRVHLEADTASKRIEVYANGSIGSIEAAVGTPERPIAEVERANYVMLDTSVDVDVGSFRVPLFHAKLHGFTNATAEFAQGRVALHTNFTTDLPEIQARYIGEAGDWLYANATNVPKSVDLAVSRNGVAWVADSNAGTSIEGAARIQGFEGTFRAHGVPKELVASWKITSGVLDATVNASGPMALVDVNASVGDGTSQTKSLVSIHAEGVPARVEAHMRKGVGLNATARNETGELAPVGFVDVGYAAKQGLGLPVSPPGANATAYVRLGDPDTEQARVTLRGLRFFNLTQPVDEVTLDEGLNITYDGAATPLNLDFESSAPGVAVPVRARGNFSTIPARVDLTFTKKGGSEENFTLSYDASARVDEFNLSVERMGNLLRAAGELPRSMNASRLGETVDAHLSDPSSITLSYAPLDRPLIPANASLDYLMFNRSDKSVALRVTGLRSAHADTSQGYYWLAHDSSQDMELNITDYTKVDATVFQGSVRSPPDSFWVNITPGMREGLIGWHADKATGALDGYFSSGLNLWRVDATRIPADFYVTVTPHGADLKANSTLGFGKINLSYTADGKDAIQLSRPNVSYENVTGVPRYSVYLKDVVRAGFEDSPGVVAILERSYGGDDFQLSVQSPNLTTSAYFRSLPRVVNLTFTNRSMDGFVSDVDLRVDTKGEPIGSALINFSGPLFKTIEAHGEDLPGDVNVTFRGDVVRVVNATDGSVEESVDNVTLSYTSAGDGPSAKLRAVFALTNGMLGHANLTRVPSSFNATYATDRSASFQAEGGALSGELLVQDRDATPHADLGDRLGASLSLAPGRTHIHAKLWGVTNFSWVNRSDGMDFTFRSLAAREEDALVALLAGDSVTVLNMSDLPAKVEAHWTQGKSFTYDATEPVSVVNFSWCEAGCRESTRHINVSAENVPRSLDFTMGNTATVRTFVIEREAEAAAPNVTFDLLYLDDPKNATAGIKKANGSIDLLPPVLALHMDNSTTGEDTPAGTTACLASLVTEGQRTGKAFVWYTNGTRLGAPHGSALAEAAEREGLVVAHSYNLDASKDGWLWFDQRLDRTDFAIAAPKGVGDTRYCQTKSLVGEGEKDVSFTTDLPALAEFRAIYVTNRSKEFRLQLEELEAAGPVSFDFIGNRLTYDAPGRIEHLRMETDLFEKQLLDRNMSIMILDVRDLPAHVEMDLARQEKVVTESINKETTFFTVDTAEQLIGVLSLDIHLVPTTQVEPPVPPPTCVGCSNVREKVFDVAETRVGAVFVNITDDPRGMIQWPEVYEDENHLVKFDGTAQRQLGLKLTDLEGGRLSRSDIVSREADLSAGVDGQLVESSSLVIEDFQVKTTLPLTLHVAAQGCSSPSEYRVLLSNTPAIRRVGIDTRCLLLPQINLEWAFFEAGVDSAEFTFRGENAPDFTTTLEMKPQGSGLLAAGHVLLDLAGGLANWLTQGNAQYQMKTAFFDGEFMWFEAEDLQEFQLGGALQGECGASKCPVYQYFRGQGLNVTFQHSAGKYGQTLTIPGQFTLAEGEPGLGGVLVTNEPYENGPNDAEVRVKNKIIQLQRPYGGAVWDLNYHGLVTRLLPEAWTVPG